jgi:hypothetical protein
VSILVHGVEDTQNARLETWDDFISKVRVFFVSKYGG